MSGYVPTYQQIQPGVIRHTRVAILAQAFLVGIPPESFAHGFPARIIFVFGVVWYEGSVRIEEEIFTSQSPSNSVVRSLACYLPPKP